MDKQTQRQEIRHRIRLLSPDYCEMADSAIAESLLALPAYGEASCIFCYISVDREVNTRPVIEDAWRSGKRVVVPRCVEKGLMELCEITCFQDLEPGSYQIPEPKAFCPILPLTAIDFAIVPCLSCDRLGHRLGHGGGYYDRCLAAADFPAASVCREQQLLDQVCLEPHDQSVDYVVTELNVYSCTP